MSRRAVAPVTGVVLLVLITILLATVVGAMALGMGGHTTNAPQAVITATIEDANYGDQKVVLTHQSGDALDVRTLRIKVLVDGTPLKYQLDVPSAGMTGFLYSPSGPFNAKSHNKIWTAGEVATFTIAGTNSPQPTAGSRVTVKIYTENEIVAKAQAYA